MLDGTKIRGVVNMELAAALEANYFCLNEILEQETKDIKADEKEIVKMILKLTNLLLEGGVYDNGF